MKELIFIQSVYTGTVYKVHELPKYEGYIHVTVKEWNEQFARRGF